MDAPFPGAYPILKKELSKVLEAVFYDFEHEKQGKSSMSRQLRLNEGTMLLRAGEIGGEIKHYVEKLVQACTDYANGHGKIEAVYEYLEFLRDELKS